MRPKDMTIYAVFVLFISSSSFVCAGTIDTVGQASYEQCGYCHEYDGNSRMPEFPRLAGQHEDYLVKQLNDFRSGHRQGVMQATAELLKDEDIHVVAQYFSQQQFTPVELPKLAAEEQSVAHRLFIQGDQARALPACVTCHDTQLQVKNVIPRLSGQHSVYLETQLVAFKRGHRSNDQGGQMQKIARQLTLTEINALAAYLARKKPVSYARHGNSQRGCKGSKTC